MNSKIQKKVKLPKNSATNSALPFNVIALLSCLVLAAIFQNQLRLQRRLGNEMRRTGSSRGDWSRRQASVTQDSFPLIWSALLLFHQKNSCLWIVWLPVVVHFLVVAEHFSSLGGGRGETVIVPQKTRWSVCLRCLDPGRGGGWREGGGGTNTL